MRHLGLVCPQAEVLLDDEAPSHIVSVVFFQSGFNGMDQFFL